MTPDELKKFGRVVEVLRSVDDQLTNVKKRGPNAAAQAAGRLKTQGASFPSLKPMTENLQKLVKAEATATKAIQEIEKMFGTFAKDPKKTAATPLADVKKKVREIVVAKIQPLDNCCATLLVIEQKFYKELQMPTMGGTAYLDLSLVFEKFLPALIKYYAAFKVELNKL